MKKTITCIVFIILAHTLFSQQIDGTWAGAFYNYSKNITPVRRLYLEIQQDGRAVWGAYSMSDSNDIKYLTCLNSVSGELSKKPFSICDLYKERVEYYDNARVGYAYCDFVNRLALHFFLIDKKEYIAGKWFTHIPLRTSDEGLGGVFVLSKISGGLSRNVNQYFPRLKKMIAKGKSNKSDNSLVIFDSLGSATPMEQQLLRLIRGGKL